MVIFKNKTWKYYNWRYLIFNIKYLINLCTVHIYCRVRYVMVRTYVFCSSHHNFLYMQHCYGIACRGRLNPAKWKKVRMRLTRRDMHLQFNTMKYLKRWKVKLTYIEIKIYFPYAINGFQIKEEAHTYTHTHTRTLTHTHIHTPHIYAHTHTHTHTHTRTFSIHVLSIFPFFMFRNCTTSSSIFIITNLGALIGMDEWQQIAVNNIKSYDIMLCHVKS